MHVNALVLTLQCVPQGLRNDFVRNIMWTFEDIHMLVGSNMPIFGGGRYPAVSLRLRLAKTKTVIRNY